MLEALSSRDGLEGRGHGEARAVVVAPPAGEALRGEGKGMSGVRGRERTEERGAYRGSLAASWVEWTKRPATAPGPELRYL